MAGEPVQQEAAHTAQRQLVSSGQESPPDLGEGLSPEVGGVERALSRMLFAMVQPPGLPMAWAVLLVSWILAGVPGSCFPCDNLSTLSLDQDKLELELVLKGSYEDTQTSALGTASAFRFHYMTAQEAELSGCLRVGFGSGAPLPTPASGQLHLLQASLWPSTCHGQGPVALSASPS